MSAGLWFGWNLEGCQTSQPRYLSDLADENHECQDIRCLSRDSNYARTEYKSRTLSSCHPAQYLMVSNVTPLGQHLVALAQISPTVPCGSASQQSRNEWKPCHFERP